MFPIAAKAGAQPQMKAKKKKGKKKKKGAKKGTNPFLAANGIMKKAV